jgi:hypothetical protein
MPCAGWSGDDLLFRMEKFKMNERERKKRREGVALGRFRVDNYLSGVRERGARCDAYYRVGHFFPTVEEAVSHWLAGGWRYEGFEADDEVDVAETMLRDAAVIVDRQTKRVVRALAYRWPELVESRLPVAMIVDQTTGVVTTETVESSAAAA